MSPKILELVKQAQIPLQPRLHNTVFIAHQVGHKQLELFAHLVVKECIKLVELEAAQYAQPTWAVELVNDMHEHFEVLK